jgi:hypothetical protein
MNFQLRPWFRRYCYFTVHRSNPTITHGFQSNSYHMLIKTREVGLEYIYNNILGSLHLKYYIFPSTINRLFRCFYPYISTYNDYPQCMSYQWRYLGGGEQGVHLHTLNFFHIQLLAINLGVTDTWPCHLGLQFSNVKHCAYTTVNQ